jgi:hypothetical protein
MMRAVLVCLLLAATTSSAQSRPGAPVNPFGEPARTTTPHLTVESSISPISAAAGSKLTVTVDVTPRRAMHVYAPGKHDYQVVGLTIAPQPWARLAPTKYPPSETYFFEPLNETVEVYSKPFRLTREVTLLDTPEARKALAGQSSVTISGQLEYQACDDKICYQPGKVPVKFVIAIK